MAPFGSGVAVQPIPQKWGENTERKRGKEVVAGVHQRVRHVSFHLFVCLWYFFLSLAQSVPFGLPCVSYHLARRE